MSVITEVKFGRPIANNAIHVKREFKKAFGLSARATNQDVIKAIGQTYKENELSEDFNGCIERFGLPEYKV